MWKGIPTKEIKLYDRLIWYLSPDLWSLKGQPCRDSLQLCCPITLWSFFSFKCSSLKKNWGFHSECIIQTSFCVWSQSTIMSTKDSCNFSPHLFAFYAVNHLVTVGATDGYLILEWSSYIYTHKVSGHICIFTFQLSALLPDTNVNNHNVLKHFLKRIILEISNLFVYCFVFIWNKV